MAKTLQFRRGTTGELSSVTGAIGELFVDTSKRTVVVMDGSTVGGFPLVTELSLKDVSVAIGKLAGDISQSSGSVAIGKSAGRFSQSYSIAIGSEAGYYYQNTHAVAIGANAGFSSQGNTAVAIGSFSGENNQGFATVSVGFGSGVYYQGLGAVAIGANAGYQNQGQNAVAIGYHAGFYQSSNSIILNATGTDLNSSNSGFFVAPIRNVASNTAYSVYYNTTTKELTYATTPVDNDSVLTSALIGDVSIVGHTISALDVYGKPATLEIDGNLNVVTGTDTIKTQLSVSTSGVEIAALKLKYANTSMETAYPVGTTIIGRPADLKNYGYNEQHGVEFTATVSDSLYITPVGSYYTSGDNWVFHGSGSGTSSSGIPSQRRLGFGTWRCTSPAINWAGYAYSGIWTRIA